MKIHNLFRNPKYDHLRQRYVGETVEMVSMDDPAPIEKGDFGEVMAVDDAGQLIVNWNSNRALNVNLGAGDVVRIIANPQSLYKETMNAAN